MLGPKRLVIASHAHETEFSPIADRQKRDGSPQRSVEVVPRVTPVVQGVSAHQLHVISSLGENRLCIDLEISAFKLKISEGADHVYPVINLGANIVRIVLSIIGSGSPPSWPETDEISTYPGEEMR